VLEALNGLGYRVDILNIDAAWFTPQSRRRIFIIGRRGVKADKSRVVFDERDERLKPGSLQRVVNLPGSIKWGFVDIPSPPQKSDMSFDEIVTSNGAKWKPDTEVDKVLRQMGQKHRAKLDELIDARSISHLTAYRRVRRGEVMVEARFDGLSGCLRPPRGGSSRQLLLEAGGGNLRVRYLSAREYARLQGAPDDFEIPASESVGMFGFGDAVCAPAITWLAENVLNQL
jgi:DNA (cytosine-5)-methyltransferase 1